MIELGVKQVAEVLHDGLLRYIEAQYHVRDTDLIQERRLLLQERGTIGREPFLESTPAYETLDGYAGLGLPSPVGELLEELAPLGVGIFPTPFVHQARALSAFFGSRGSRAQDLIVATGTGSGKTETFLMPILGQMAREGAERRDTWAKRGTRAIILYPMNALVSDQLTRLRRLFGSELVAQRFRERYGRHPQFGMYTSRTPYPGKRTNAKDAARVKPLLDYYLTLERRAAEGETAEVRMRSAMLVRELKARGRWPAKDLQAFAGAPGRPWASRLITCDSDRELLTRQEMQKTCPDILVTNYSMLEYMLLRPIEREIFRQTRDWLASDPRNELTLVVDEAHMYRGVGGAEVALLIRRLQARLGIPRERLRCILTSASLGSGPEVEAAVHRFAVGLTGALADGRSPFFLVPGARKDRPNDRAGDEAEAAALASLDLVAFFRRAEDPDAARGAIAALAARLGWPAPPSLGTAPDARAGASSGSSAAGASRAESGPAPEPDAPLRRYLFARLGEVGPMNRLINVTAGEGRAFSELAAKCFSGVAIDVAEAATTALVALGTYANDGERPLLPARAHLFFRGLPTLWACLDRNCTARRHLPPDGGPTLLGRLYTEPRTHCTCASRARVYEVYAHRDCGAVFLRVFGRGSSPTFYWHERGGVVDPTAVPLTESLLILEEPHENMTASDKTRVEPVWVELTTGRVHDGIPPAGPDAERRFRRVWRPRAQAASPLLRPAKAIRRGRAAGTRGGSALGARREGLLVSCPNCTRKTGYKILDLATKGEQPFANLVRHQLELQPAVRPFDEQYPNGGRKVLLFADGRQKAARLARDLPREVEFDSFRQAIALAVQRLDCAGRRVTLDERLYQAFVTVCHDFHLHFFDQEENSQAQLLRDIEAYRKRYDEDLETLLDEGREMRPPARFRQALLRQLADPYYSLSAACVAVVEPSDSALRQLRQQLERSATPFPVRFVERDLLAFALAWIQELLDNGAFDPEVPEPARRQVNEYFRAVARGTKFPRLEAMLSTYGGLTPVQVDSLREHLYAVLTREDASQQAHLVPGKLRLRVAVEVPWHQCRSCGVTQFMPLFGRCAGCESDRLVERAPNDPYMTARNGYIREPLRAVLAGARPVHVTAEEHTAQLSQRDQGAVYATTEEYELRFQDVQIDETKPPVDVLSCTTTMEVGIDIGSLTAVGLRNVPPQRENYQQRAGRSGRRGSAVSTVITYAQDGPHDFFYYSHPADIISGPPREPRIKVDNARLAERHVHSFLVQTFFHETLDRLGPAAEPVIAETRTNIMSAFGEARAFFLDDGDFSFAAFRRWVARAVAAPDAVLPGEVAAWLPDSIPVPGRASTPAERRAFVVQVAERFVRSLDEMGREFRHPSMAGTVEAIAPTLARAQAEARTAAGDDVAPNGAADDEDEEGLLLNLLFDRGLLPSYAFPTELASFCVFDFDERRFEHRIKERPQQGKDKALSEYAPGRLLVIDKRTYRVGGLFVEDPRVLNPGEAIFARQLPIYVSCPGCTYAEVRSRRGESPQVCPVCHTVLAEREMVDPPAFAPENGHALRERDRDQGVSYAGEATFPRPTHPAALAWRNGAGPYFRFAFGENQELVIANKGPKGDGFFACQTCGAAWPKDLVPPGGVHSRPYPLTRQHKRSGLTRDCSGPLTSEPIYLGHQFRTDILVLQLALHAPLRYDPQDPWLHDALRSTAETLSLAASRRLQIDPGELAAGYRLMPPTGTQSGALATAELYLYDTSAGGAGYAAEAGDHLDEILWEAERLAGDCQGEGCEGSCPKCLRHYGNRFWHERLDRRLASQVLAYAARGAIPAVAGPAEQAERLVGLARYLELEGWQVEHGAEALPLVVSLDGVRAAVATFPALLEESAVRERHSVVAMARSAGLSTVLLRDYVVSRDLPAAYGLLRRALDES